MRSQQVGEIVLDVNQLQSDIDILDNIQFSNTYDDFAYGFWKTCMLWNQDGKSNNSAICVYDGIAIPTDLGIKLNYLYALMERYFKLEYLKFARIFLARNNGLVIPHRDYLELTEQYTRIHVPIQTNSSCLCSEEDTVFHMGIGEVWFLDATKTHSAACFSESNRYHLVLDFVTNVPISELITEHLITHEIEPVRIIERSTITKEYLNKLYALSDLICHENFRHITAILAGVHFKKTVNASAMFQWLLEITKLSKQSELVDRAESLYKRCIITREA